MYEEKKLELRLRALEAQTTAQAELLALIGKAFIAQSPGAAALQAELRTVAAYDGPSGARKAVAALAASMIPGA